MMPAPPPRQRPPAPGPIPLGPALDVLLLALAAVLTAVGAELGFGVLFGLWP